MPLMQTNETQKWTLPQNSFSLRPVDLREPVVDAGEHREDRSRRDDVVEVADDVIGVVQMDVGGGEAERQSGQSADAEHRQERQREQHRRREPYRPAP